MRRMLICTQEKEEEAKDILDLHASSECMSCSFSSQRFTFWLKVYKLERNICDWEILPCGLKYSCIFLPFLLARSWDMQSGWQRSNGIDHCIGAAEQHLKLRWTEHKLTMISKGCHNWKGFVSTNICHKVLFPGQYVWGKKKRSGRNRNLFFRCRVPSKKFWYLRLIVAFNSLMKWTKNFFQTFCYDVNWTFREVSSITGLLTCI